MIHAKTALTALTAVAIVGSTHADVVSTFDTDNEGWDTINDATGFTWDDTLGNPAGAIRARDIVGGGLWFFSGSDDYLGDHSGAYGQQVTWDILGITGNHTSATTGADIMIVGGGLSIGIELNVLPVNGQWTSWGTVISADADWFIVNSLNGGTLTANAASEAQIRAVLADITGFHIRGEFTNGGDATALDNVILREVPTPGAAALLGLAGFAGTRRRRR